MSPAFAVDPNENDVASVFAVNPNAFINPNVAYLPSPSIQMEMVLLLPSPIPITLMRLNQK